MEFKNWIPAGVVAVLCAAGFVAYDQIRLAQAVRTEIRDELSWLSDAETITPTASERLIVGMASTLIAPEEFEIAWGPGRIEFPCIEPHMAAIRQSVDALPAAFAACRDTILASTGHIPRDLGEPELFAIFVTIAANRIAPYGDSSQLNWRLIGQERSMHCGQHSILIAEAIKHFYPEVESVRYGVETPAIGNHALVSYRRGERSMILDGTTALVAFASIDDALDGRLISSYQVVDFYTGTDLAIERLRRQVRGSFRLGAMREEYVIDRSPATGA